MTFLHVKNILYFIGIIINCYFQDIITELKNFVGQQ